MTSKLVQHSVAGVGRRLPSYLTAIIVVGLSGSFVANAIAGSFIYKNGHFSTIELPGTPTGINDAGHIAGQVNGFSPGFVYVDGKSTFTDNSRLTDGYAYLNGINNSGQVVGNAGDRYSQFAFVIDGGPSGNINTGDIRGLADPSSGYLGNTSGMGISNAGAVVGNSSARESTEVHGFVEVDGHFTDFDFPGALWTSPVGINNSGAIVGTFGGVADGSFLYVNGAFETIDVPGATTTLVTGINDAGHIVGSFTDRKGTHGFLDVDGNFTTLDAPGAGSTFAKGINNHNEIVGTFSGLAAPEPTATVTLIAGLLALGSVLRSPRHRLLKAFSWRGWFSYNRLGRLIGAETCEFSQEPRHLGGPVMSTACYECRLSPLETRHQPVAIELDRRATPLTVVSRP